MVQYMAYIPLQTRIYKLYFTGVQQSLNLVLTFNTSTFLLCSKMPRELLNVKSPHYNSFVRLSACSCFFFEIQSIFYADLLTKQTKNSKLIPH